MAIKYRSNEIMHGEDAPFYRSLFKAMGYADEELDHKPLIGIANSWSTACPGSFNLDKVNEFVKKEFIVPAVPLLNLELLDVAMVSHKVILE